MSSSEDERDSMFSSGSDERLLVEEQTSSSHGSEDEDLEEEEEEEVEEDENSSEEEEEPASKRARATRQSSAKPTRKRVKSSKKKADAATNKPPARRPDRMVAFSVEPIREQVICRLCEGLYREPYTTIKCFHTFCKSCLATALHSSKYSTNSENYNSCPQCNLYLGRMADPASVAMPDRVLETLIDKILFPEIAQGDREAERQHYKKLGIEPKELPGDREDEDDDMMDDESRAKKDSEEAETPINQGSTVVFKLVPEKSETATGGEDLASKQLLGLPYLKTQGNVLVHQLKIYIRMKLASVTMDEAKAKAIKAATLHIRCGKSEPLANDMTVAQIEETIWKEHKPESEEMMQLEYHFAKK